MAYTTIDKPTDYFNTLIYTGNGTTPRSITGVGFQPDLVWLKGRSVAEHHIWTDAVRGGNKQLYSSLTLSEGTDTNRIQSLDSDGFTIGDAGAINQSSATYVAWNFLASNTTASNTNGSITSTVSANTTSGFSIVSWTGDGSDATIGHGLSSTPKMIIHKHRSGTVQWNVYHANAGTGGYLRIDGDNAFSSNSGFFGTAPTSSVFSPGSHPYMSGSGNDNIAYCFAEKKGFSKFGSYTGNGNNNGTFVYTGFKPAFCIVKRTDGVADWNMYDNKRIGYNPLNYFVYPNLSNAEDTSNPQWFDLLSNGFQLRNTSTMANTSGGSYIYMAFAESPFVTSTGIPTCAR